MFFGKKLEICLKINRNKQIIYNRKVFNQYSLNDNIKYYNPTIVASKKQNIKNDKCRWMNLWEKECISFVKW